MEISRVTRNGADIAVINNNSVILINDLQDALDLIGNILFEINVSRVILDKSAFCEEFFDLKTKLAGDVLQKFTTYQIAVAIVGDFSGYTSKSLHDFFYETNRGNSVFFLENEELALEKLSRV